MEPRPINKRTANENYNHDRDGANRVARLKSYEYTIPREDWDGVVIQAMDLKTGNESILDIGTGTGSLPMRLKDKESHSGFVAGIDPFVDQIAGGLWYHYSYDQIGLSNSVEFREGIVQEIPYPDYYFDRVLSIDQMYTVEQEEQDLAFEQIKRVLAPDGFFLLRTSGSNNKYVQRHAERFIAKYLGLEPPELMNHHYNSERAATHLKTHFHNIVHKPMHRAFVFDYDTIDVFRESLKSMMDQFGPIVPEGGPFNEAYEAWKSKYADPMLNRTGRLIDLCERDLFVASDPI